MNTVARKGAQTRSRAELRWPCETFCLGLSASGLDEKFSQVFAIPFGEAFCKQWLQSTRASIRTLPCVSLVDMCPCDVSFRHWPCLLLPSCLTAMWRWRDMESVYCIDSMFPFTCAKCLRRGDFGPLTVHIHVHMDLRSIPSLFSISSSSASRSSSSYTSVFAGPLYKRIAYS